MQILILDSVANMLRTNRGGCGVLLVHFYLFARAKQQNIVRKKSWVKRFRIAHGRLLLCLFNQCNGLVSGARRLKAISKKEPTLAPVPR